jgi:hypothetical protein
MRGNTREDEGSPSWRNWERTTTWTLEEAFMPRPLTWLPRLDEIRREINQSVRSHYERKDLEPIFHLQHRAAHQLMQLLPCTRIGRSLIIERQALINFLDRIQEAEDPASVLQSFRAAKEAPKRRTLRNLVQKDNPPVALETLPTSIALSPGEATIRFVRMEDLAASLLALAQVLYSEDGFAAFEKQYQIASELPDSDTRQEELNDRARLEAELIELERAYAKRRGGISEDVRNALSAPDASSRSSVCTSEELVSV